MKVSFVFVFAFVCALLSPSAFAQSDFAPGSLALLDRLDGELLGAGDDPIDRYLAYDGVSADLAAAAQEDGMMPLAMTVANVDLASDVRLDYVGRGLEWIELGTGPIERNESALGFITAAYFTPESTPPTRQQLYELGEALDRLNAAGMAIEELGIQAAPAMLEWIESAIKIYKAGLSAAELADGDKPDRARIVRDFVDLVPPSLAPALNGPAGAAFADLLDWNGQLWDVSTAGIDVVADAIARGELDQERYAAVAATLERLAADGPWDSDTAREFIKKWAESLPGVGKLVKALWPDPLPAQCQPINCDCDSIDWGILTTEYRKECKAEEIALKRQCRDTKAVAGTCHPTASGPAAFPG